MSHNDHHHDDHGHHDDHHHHHGHDGHHDGHNHSDDLEPALQTLIWQQIEFEKIRTLNELELDSGAKIVEKTWAQRMNAEPELVSDTDEQMLMFVPYVALFPLPLPLPFPSALLLLLLLLLPQTHTTTTLVPIKPFRPPFFFKKKGDTYSPRASPRCCMYAINNNQTEKQLHRRPPSPLNPNPHIRLAQRTSHSQNLSQPRQSRFHDGIRQLGHTNPLRIPNL